MHHWPIHCWAYRRNWLRTHSDCIPHPKPHAITYLVTNSSPHPCTDTVTNTLQP